MTAWKFCNKWQENCSVKNRGKVKIKIKQQGSMNPDFVDFVPAENNNNIVNNSNDSSEYLQREILPAFPCISETLQSQISFTFVWRPIAAWNFMLIDNDWTLPIPAFFHNTTPVKVIEKVPKRMIGALSDSINPIKLNESELNGTGSQRDMEKWVTVDYFSCNLFTASPANGSDSFTR